MLSQTVLRMSLPASSFWRQVYSTTGTPYHANYVYPHKTSNNRGFFFLSVKSRTSCAFPTATSIQLQMIAVKPHGHRQDYHWLSMVRTIGNALALYHRNHKDKGFNGNGHSPGPVISRCVACVLAIHAQVMGVWAQRLDGRAPPAMCMATHRQPTADEQPGGKGG